MDRVLEAVPRDSSERAGGSSCAGRRTLAAGDYLGAHFGETPVIAVFCFNPKNMAITDAKQERVSVVGGGLVYTAVENLLLACRAEGLGCVLTTLLCECEPEVRKLWRYPTRGTPRRRFRSDIQSAAGTGR